MNRWTRLAIVVVGGVGLDQLTKWLAESMLRPRAQVQLVDGFFSLLYVRNRGAFFSLGESLQDGVRRAVFVVATLVAIGVIVQLYRRAQDSQRLLSWALALLLAGAIGNLVDRVRYAEVVDFLHLQLGDLYHWATFNVADVLITAGLALLVVDLWRARGRQADAPPAAESRPA